jgi:HEAT repeat protein
MEMIRSEKLIPILRIALSDKNIHVRLLAVETLRVLKSWKDEKTISYIAKELKDSNSDVRYCAVKAMEKIRSEKLIPALKIALKDKEDYVRLLAVETLQAIGGDAIASAMLIPLIDEDLEIRAFSVAYFSRHKSSMAVKFLRKHLHSAKPDIRSICIEGLAKIGTKEAVVVMGKAFEYLPKSDFFSLINTLEKTGNIEASKYLMLEINNKKFDKKLRIQVLKALGNLKQKSAIPVLKETLKHKDPDLRCYTLQAIGKIGSKKMHSLLDDGLLDDVTAVRESALDALKAHKDNKCRDLLLSHYQRESEKKLRKKTLDILKANFPKDAKIKELLK